MKVFTDFFQAIFKCSQYVQEKCVPKCTPLSMYDLFFYLMVTQVMYFMLFPEYTLRRTEKYEFSLIRKENISVRKTKYLLLTFHLLYKGFSSLYLCLLCELL